METSLSTDCEYCNGFGSLYPIRDGVVIYSETTPCICTQKELKEKKQQRLLESCSLPPFADKMTFENFEMYVEVKEAYQLAKKMADEPGVLRWLGLIGQNGNGKTHLAVAICKAWIDAGFPARYAFVSLLLDELREGFKKEDAENSYEGKFRYYCNIPLLLLDDFGTESKTVWVQEKLDTLIDYRLMNNLSLIVTSNLSLDEMPSRIRSRLMRHSKGSIVGIMAEDYSLRRKRNG
ncbi:hypothetical protein LCGC14_2358380 [marine sediment metagenome]|uniref:IstB-like ATP-binding domain-containing protein n=1 Tax=marine sediment metagenome TaxID=412755 RepID=A0A0F9CUL2_9ZZZZ